MRWGLVAALLAAAWDVRGETLLRGIDPGESLVPGTTIAVRVEGALPGGTERELVLSLDGGRTYPLRVTREAAADASVLSFQVPNLRAREARLGLRVGERGEEERLVAVSPPFAIAEGGAAEELREVRGEPATREAGGSLPLSRPPASRAGGRPTVGALDGTEGIGDLPDPQPALVSLEALPRPVSWRAPLHATPSGPAAASLLRFRPKRE